MSSSLAHSLRIFIIAIGYLAGIIINVIFCVCKIITTKKLNKLLLIRINMHLPFNIFSYPFANKTKYPLKIK